MKKRKIFDNFEGIGCYKAQEYLLENIGVNTGNLNVIKTNTSINEFENTFTKLLSTNQNVICVKEYYPDLYECENWIYKKFPNIQKKAKGVFVVQSFKEYIKSRIEAYPKTNTKKYDELLEKIDYLSENSLDFSFLDFTSIDIPKAEFEKYVEDYNNLIQELSQNINNYKIVLVTSKMLLSNKIKPILTSKTKNSVLLYDNFNQFYLGESIKLNTFKSKINVSLKCYEIQRFQKYNKFIEKIIAKIKILFIDHSDGQQDKKIIRFQLDKDSLNKRYQIKKNPEKYSIADYEQNAFQDIFLEVLKFNIDLLDNSSRYEYLCNRFDKMLSFAKFKNGIICGLNYKYLIKLFEDVYSYLIEEFKKYKKELMQNPYDIHEAINITTLYQHQKFFTNLFKRNDLILNYGKLETYDYSLLETLNEYVTIHKAFVIDRYFDEYLFKIIREKVFSLPGILNYNTDFDAVDMLDTYRIIEIVILNKNIILFAKTKNHSTESIFGKGSTFWKNNSYLDIKENLIKPLAKDDVPISLITHKKHLKKFNATFPNEFENEIIEDVSTYFGATNFKIKIKDTSVLFILGNHHFGSEKYENDLYFYFDNLPDSLLMDTRFNYLDKNFSYLKFDIENYMNKDTRNTYIKNTYEQVIEKSIDTTTYWALDQMRNDFNMFGNNDKLKIVIMYGKVPSDLKESITIVEHSLKPELLYLLVLKILYPNDYEKSDLEYFYFNLEKNIDNKLYSKVGIKDKINSAIRQEFPNLKKVTGEQEEYYILNHIRVRKSYLFEELKKTRSDNKK